jgi:hypothetical protein
MSYIPQLSYRVTTTLASAVADDATFTTAYPTGTTLATFDAGLLKEGEAKIVVNGSSVWEAADPGIEVTTLGASTVTYTNRTGAELAAGSEIEVSLPVWASAPVFYQVPVFLMTAIADGDLVTAVRPGIDGYITHWYWVQNAAVTTAAKLSTLNLEINTTNLTGGTIALTSAACTPMGKMVASSRITGANRITKADSLSVEAASTTAFIEGSGHLVIRIQPDVL